MLHRFAYAISVAIVLAGTPLWADLILLTELELDVPSEVGGLSGLEMNETGTAALLLSDRGTVFAVDITRDGTGAATALHVTAKQRLRHDGEHNHPDSEGLARLSNERLAITAEDPTRLLFYRWGNKDPDYTPTVPTSRELDDNRGLEALAVSAEGALYTLFETPDDAVFPTFVFENGAWRVGPGIPADKDFSIVGADFDDRGRLYILERAFSGLGFRTQIRRITFDGQQARDERLLRTALGRFDNLEGLSVWTDPEGRTRLSLVSDNNFLRILRMTLVEFALLD